MLFRYDSEGKETSLASVGSGMSPSIKSGARSMYTDRVSLLHITSSPSLGEDKVYILPVLTINDLMISRAILMLYSLKYEAYCTEKIRLVNTWSFM